MITPNRPQKASPGTPQTRTTKVRLAIKRRTTNRQIAKIKRPHLWLLVEYMNAHGMGGGIVTLAKPPKNRIERQILSAAKHSFYVEEVKSRDTDHPKNIFSNLAFAVAIAEWWCKKTSNPYSVTLKKISCELETEQAKIVAKATDRDQQLEHIFQTYYPSLIDVARKWQWWKAYFGYLKKPQNSLKKRMKTRSMLKNKNKR